MDIRQLEYACEVAVTSSFTKAAERLFVTQPALSLQISKLEEEIGFPIFVRTTRSVTTTNFGKSFIIYAQNVLREWNILKYSVQVMSQSFLRSLSIGFFAQIEYTPLPELFAAFIESQPGVTFDFCTGSGADLFSRLFDGRADLIMYRCYETDIPAGVSSFPLYEDPVYVLLNENDPLTERDEVNRADLCEYHLICEKEGPSNSYGSILTGFSQNMISLKHTPIYIEQGNLLPQLISSPGYYSFATKQSGLSISKSHPHLKAIPLSNCKPVTVFILYRSENRKPEIPVLCEYMKSNTHKLVESI